MTLHAQRQGDPARSFCGLDRVTDEVVEVREFTRRIQANPRIMRCSICAFYAPDPHFGDLVDVIKGPMTPPSKLYDHLLKESGLVSVTAEHGEGRTFYFKPFDAGAGSKIGQRDPLPFAVAERRETELAWWLIHREERWGGAVYHETAFPDDELGKDDLPPPPPADPDDTVDVPPAPGADAFQAPPED